MDKHFPVPLTDDNGTTYLSSVNTHIESIIHSLVREINTRALSPSSPIWPFLSDDFVTRGNGPNASSKLDTLASLNQHFAEWPDYNLDVTAMGTELNSKLDAATVFTNVDVSGGPGVPKGLSRKLVSVFEFKKSGSGRWMALGVTTLPGSW